LEDGNDDDVYFLQWLCLLGKHVSPISGLASVPNNCQLILGKVHRVNRIDVISGVIVLLKCLLEISCKFVWLDL